jgi:hypothetical protein
LRALLLIAVALLALAGTATVALGGPTSQAAATCADYANQAAAQRAADTRDGDGDGIYCESLPCPCAKGAPTADARPKACLRPKGIVSIGFSGTTYPNIRRHALDAIGAGWPRTLVLNRRGADARRDRLLSHVPTKPGFDRDEYPPAVGRGTGPGLTRGRSPRGWKADLRYVPSYENRSHGSTLGIKLRRFCDGVRFRYAFY